MLVVLFLLFYQITSSTLSAKDVFRKNCDEEPTPAERKVCLMLQKTARLSREEFEGKVKKNKTSTIPPTIPKHLQPGPVMPGARGQAATHPYECMTVTCLCPYFKGHIGSNNQCVLENGRPLTMAYRKEFRMMSDDERNRYHRAMTELKSSGEYDRLTVEHFRVGTASGAHAGPGFLPWHREFLKRVEIALRLVDPTVAIPYWDMVLDNYLDDPRDSILFSPLFVGENDALGNVVTGPYGYWSTTEGGNAIKRNLGSEGFLFSESHIANVVNQRNIEHVLAYTAPLLGCPVPENSNALEFVHSVVHLWVGGHMHDPPTSANDPLFYTFHAFVDLIWEIWRQSRQTPEARELDYPPDLILCADPQHFADAPMRPYYNLVNRDGLSNMYTDQMYRYAPRATCSRAMPHCGSAYLFCDLRFNPHCVSKIKLNGNCRRFEGLDACFEGKCINGYCTPDFTPKKKPFTPRTKPSKSETRRRKQSAIKRRSSSSVCLNKNPCCERWMRDGECRKNKQFMHQLCAASCKVCQPAYNTTDECSDRHTSCRQWQTQGQCTASQELFMHENCRKSCKLCSKHKSVGCPKLSTIIKQVGEQLLKSDSRQNNSTE